MFMSIYLKLLYDEYDMQIKTDTRIRILIIKSFLNLNIYCIDHLGSLGNPITSRCLGKYIRHQNGTFFD